MNPTRLKRPFFACPARPAGQDGAPRVHASLSQGMVTMQPNIEKSMLVPFSSDASVIVHL